jgi:hypothetical protein
MHEAIILLKDQPDGTSSPFAAVFDAAGFPGIAFRDTAAFSDAIGQLLTVWLAHDTAELSASGAGA